MVWSRKSKLALYDDKGLILEDICIYLILNGCTHDRDLKRVDKYSSEEKIANSGFPV